MPARYAKTKHHVATDGLNPGRWYPVVSVDATTGVVVVRCEELRQDFQTHASKVDLRHDPPSRAEVFVEGRFGPRDPAREFPEARYRAICPRGHDLGVVQPTIREVFCAVCGTVYEATLTGGERNP